MEYYNSLDEPISVSNMVNLESWVFPIVYESSFFSTLWKKVMQKLNSKRMTHRILQTKRKDQKLQRRSIKKLNIWILEC